MGAYTSRLSLSLLTLLAVISIGCSTPTLKPSSIKGKGELYIQVYDRELSVPLKEVTIRLGEEYRSVETDDKGIAIITDIDSGSYTISISRSWFKTITESDYEIKPDVITELEYTMVSNDRLGE